MTWSCAGADTGSFAGQALGDSCAFFTGGSASQGSELGLWLWVGGEWGGPAATLTSFQSSAEGEPAWALVLTPEPGLHLAYSETFPGSWAFTADLGAVPTDCWCWVSLSAADGAFRWSVWAQDGTIGTGNAPMPGPSGYSVTGDGQIAIGHDLTGLANATWGGGSEAMALDGGVKISRLLYVELATEGNQIDPDTSTALVQTLPGEGTAAFLIPRLSAWPVMASARAGNFGGATGAFSASFAASGQGYNLYTTTPHQGYVFANGPAAVLEWVRLSHGSGQGYWQSRGDVTEEWAGGAKQLSLPLATLSAAPDVLMGKDPASGLPAYCPVPMSSTSTVALIGGGSRPAPPATCLQMRCGVATECTNHLLSLYEQWASWLDPLVAGVADFALLAGLIDPFFDALIEGLELASDIAIAKAIQDVLKLGVGAITGSLFPSLNPDAQTEVRKALFCQLACVGDVITVMSTDVMGWHDTVAGLTDLPGLSRDLLALLLQFTPLADWQASASEAGTSSACNSWTCP